MTHSDDLFTGNWALNPAKSTFDPNHRPRVATMRWDRTVDGYHMRAEGQKDDGQTVVDQTTFVLDGREYPLSAAPGFTASSEQPDPHTVRAIGRKNGKIIGEGTYTVSEDGSSLTASVRGIDLQHRQFQTVVVWDRQHGGRATS